MAWWDIDDPGSSLLRIRLWISRINSGSQPIGMNSQEAVAQHGEVPSRPELSSSLLNCNPFDDHEAAAGAKKETENAVPQKAPFRRTALGGRLSKLMANGA